MNISIELKINEDGRKFLNFWNYVNGEDVVCQIIEGKLISDNGDGPEISLPEFLSRVEEKVNSWKEQ